MGTSSILSLDAFELIQGNHIRKERTRERNGLVHAPSHLSTASLATKEHKGRPGPTLPFIVAFMALFLSVANLAP
jgi:hypothetical protein